MMIVKEVEHGLDLAKPSEGYERTPGLHMSSLYNSLYEELEPKRFAKSSKPDATRMELGTSFEEVLEPALSARLLGSRPGEFITTDGTDIIYTPDHLIFNGPEGNKLVLGEFKCTWMSIRNGITDQRFAKWMTQMKLYCHHLETPYARLYTLFVNGDYSWRGPHGGPHVRAWDITFTKRELVDEWNLVLRHARRKGLLK
jgi:hypothetical protein